MHENDTATLPHDVFSADEIAEAAQIEVAAVLDALAAGYVPSFRGYVATADAILLVRVLGAGDAGSSHERAPISLLTHRKRRGGVGLVASGSLHALGVIGLLFVTSLGLMDVTRTDVTLKDPTPQKLVYMVALGPGGGGGGGGLKMPAPPPRAQRKPLVRLIKRTPSPVPRVRRTPPPPPRPLPPRPPLPIEPPPRPVEPLRVEPPKPQPAPAVQAPVVAVPTDPVDMPGLITNRKTAETASAGPGTGGGVGTGAGTGIGEGTGGGIGPGRGGGTGGGPYQPGSGISPPTLVREVKPSYTDEARRRAIEGDVVLEIVVRRDGSVGDVQRPAQSRRGPRTARDRRRPTVAVRAGTPAGHARGRGRRGLGRIQVEVAHGIPARRRRRCFARARGHHVDGGLATLARHQSRTTNRAEALRRSCTRQRSQPRNPRPTEPSRRSPLPKSRHHRPRQSSPRSRTSPNRRRNPWRRRNPSRCRAQGAAEPKGRSSANADGKELPEPRIVSRPVAAARNTSEVADAPLRPKPIRRIEDESVTVSSWDSSRRRARPEPDDRGACPRRSHVHIRRTPPDVHGTLARAGGRGTRDSHRRRFGLRAELGHVAVVRHGLRQSRGQIAASARQPLELLSLRHATDDTGTFVVTGLVQNPPEGAPLAERRRDRLLVRSPGSVFRERPRERLTSRRSAPAKSRRSSSRFHRPRASAGTASASGSTTAASSRTWTVADRRLPARAETRLTTRRRVGRHTSGDAAPIRSDNHGTPAGIAARRFGSLFAAPAAQERPTGQGFSFRTGVELINVTATVTDDRGRFVPGLSAQDFVALRRRQAADDLSSSTPSACR